MDPANGLMGGVGGAVANQINRASCCFRFGRSISHGTSISMMTLGVASFAGAIAFFATGNYLAGGAAAAAAFQLPEGIWVWTLIPREEMEQALQSYIDEVVQLQNDNKALASQLQVLQGQRDSLQTLVKDLKAQTNGFQNAIGQGAEKLDKERDDLKTTKDAYSALLNQFQNYRNAMVVTIHLLGEMTKRFEGLHDKLPGIKDAIDKADASGVKLKQDIALGQLGDVQATSVAQQFNILLTQLQTMGTVLQTQILPAVAAQAKAHDEEFSRTIEDLKAENATVQGLIAEAKQSSVAEEQAEEQLDRLITALNKVEDRQLRIADQLAALKAVNDQLSNPQPLGFAARMMNAFSRAPRATSSNPVEMV